MMAWKLAFCCLVLVLLLEIQLVNSYTKGRHSKSLPYVRRGIKGFFRRNKCDNPAPPVNGQMRCQLSHRNRRVYECVATCIKGFEFPGKLAEMKRICNSFDGSWRPITEFPECEAICDPPCINGGKCAGNNHCICPPNFRGSSCNYDTSLCNPSDSLKFIGSWQCNHTQQETKCSLNCAQGTEFESQPADIYTCSVEGTWNPATAPKCIPVNVIHPTGSPYFPADKIKTIGIEEQKHSGVCATWGQFHYRTFDGSMYSFQGPCAYVLAKDSRDNTFSIHVKNDPSCVSSKTCHRLIVIYLGGDKYKLMHSNKKANVYHGTEEIPVPSTSGSLLLEKIAGYLVIKSSLGFSLKWDGKDTVLLSLASSLKNNTSGLCGRFDGSKENDFELVNGEAGGSVSAFANSWKMNDLGENCPDSVSQEHTCTYRTPEEKKVSEEALKTCQILWDTKYSVCHHIVNPIPYIEACRMDYCACSVSREECVCNSLAEYFRECVRLGGKIPGGWRSAKLCPLKCPSDMVYLDCGSSCPKMCTSVKYDCEDEHCVDGCHCPEGTVLLHNRCVKQDNCPCLHGGKYYEPGEKIEQECNSCECRAGEWECTKQKCEARCASTGDPHYKTFDGKNYDFLGTCSYYLVYHDKFTIVQENAPCQTAKIAGKKNTPFSNFGSCTKSVIITIGNSILTLKQNFQVSLNDHDIRIFPHTAPGLHIFMASSLFMKVELATGMSLLWDGKNRVYIDAPSSHFNKVKGLCGTFNHNQKDDFLTLEGDIEADVNTFAKKWTLGECKEQIPADEAKRPCDIYPQKSAEAQKFCSRLKSNYFRTGHDVVDPEPFYKKCIFDMCSCESKPEDCLCPAFADYGAECAKKGVLIRWRDNIKECSLKCTGGQTYQECADPCQHSCLTIASNVKCLKKCVEGCACPPGTTLNNDEMCIPVSECQCIFEGKEYLPNSKRLDGSDVCICENAVWNCRAASLKELVSVTNPDDLMQRDPEYCGKQLNMEYTNCVPVCPPTCQNKLVEQECATRICKPGCICKPGFVLDTDTKQCVKIAQCGCYHGNKRFVEGETIQLECNTCTCTSGIWKCGKKECPGICTTWGESHFSSFDGKMFDFQGDCEYILSKGKLDKSRSFTVIIKNVPCGTSGVTCSKSLTVDVGGEEKVTLTQNKPVPKTGYTSNFIVREVGLFVSVYTKHGVTVQWDKGTRVYVRVDTKWKGRLKGLCGNFDDDQSNDFRTPSGGPPEARPVVFGNSWKVHESCPYPRDIKDTCLLHPQRRTWALSKCGVLKSDIFKPCHSEVSLDPYYERCVFDACACDSGGDCECLCTALAAYAQECNFHGVPIKWRSQELCPIQCEDCAEYQACLSTCPKLTCETQYLYATLNEDCAFEPCVEGCETKPCPFGQIYNNDREFKCIPIVDCQVPCKKINGKVYMEGERVTDPETVDPCQSCFCQKGELICEGEPCATSTTRAYQRDKYPCKKTGWTPWMNSPYQVGGDYELLEDLQLFQVYSEYCGTDNITKIECRVVGSKKSIKAARQYATCDLPKGLVCNDREQTSGMCQDYEIRVYCQCKAEPVISPSTTPLIITEVVTVVELPSECTAPGWTFWMNSNKPDEIGDDESIGELRKKYVFCPESEIEKVECRVASTKSSYEFSKDQNVQCSKEGLICKNSGRGDFSTCADYEVRFYCKCADTACDFPRGMEKDYISGQEVSVSSFRSPSTLGNKARLNGNSAWSAEYLSTDQWIQVDLQELQDVTGVITQGSPLQPEWVTAYKVSYSRDNVAFSVVKSPDGSETVFTGNNDQNTPVTNKFDEPLKVRFVRIIPFQWKGWISLRLEILGCNREIPVGTTTVPPCVPGWTRYFNIDSPKSGDGDIELFKDIRTKYDLCEDSFIQKIECRSFVNGQMVDHTETGDVGIKCSINKGLVCLNWLQKKGKLCHDYSIRVYCGCGPIHTETESITPVVTTSSVTIPTCTEGWTNFYNTDVPFTGGGDFESVKELIKKYQFCSVDQVIDINCKASVKSPLKGAGEQLVDWKETGDKAVECSTSKGLVCYNNQQGKGGKCHDYSIQLYCQCVPEPRHRVLCNWTDWWNKDDPDGEGDIESIEMYQNEYGVCRKPELKAIECRLSKTKHDYREVRQKVTCDIDTGLSCYNKHQIGKCHDYEVRFFCAGDECPGIIPPTKPTPCVSSWTPFFNTDSPTSGEGDIELLVNIQKRGSVCFDKYIAGIECKTRIGKTVVDYTESGDFGVKCSLAVGLVCENSLQKKGRRCHDYSIRFFCSCVKPKTTTPQPVITTSPCPLTQVYDDCGYRCNQTCQSFFNLLVKEQKCVLGTPSDLCIPGCRPTKTCSAPYVWRDYSTCVRKEECTCVLPDGTILSPGRVIDYNCQKCQCQDNHLICIPIPHCGETPTKEVFTQPTPTHAEQNRCWTNWINIDSPLSGSGDMEDLTEIRLKYSLCSNPLAIECRVVSSKESSVDAGQNAECDLKTGLHCWNNVNGDEGCYDYEIRLLCPCPGSTTSTSFLSTTTPQPTCTSGWTKWFSSHVVDGKGDYETLQNIQSKGFKLPCESNMITAIECRPIGIPSGVPKQNIVCDIKLGFICENRQGKGGQTCYDYEVRFLCECEGTTVTAEVTTESFVTSPLVTTVVIVPTTPSVLPPCTNYKHLISGPTPLPDENLKASSSLNSNSEPQNSRLTLQKGPNSDGAWIPAYFDKDQYLEVDLGKTQPVYGIIVKGQDKGQSWVTAFRVMYSSNDQSFSFVTESSNYKVAKVFTGNYDSFSEVKHIFVNPFEARYIRVQPLEWVRQIALRLELLGCEGIPKPSTVAPTPSPVCQDKMGLENGRITPDQVRVTSSKGPNFGPSAIALNSLATKGSAGGWVAKEEDSNQFVEINLLAPKNLTGLITQGRNGISQWVTSYYIAYKSTKDAPYNYLLENKKPKIFAANFDSDTQVTNYFPKMIRAQFLHIHPFRWHNWIAMRLELLGCFEATTEVISELPVTSTTPFIISKCKEPMGLENGQIQTGDILVSSSLSPQSGSNRIRLNTESGADGTGGWVAKVNDQKQFVEISFPSIRELSGIITQGREDADNWVTNFAVFYTIDHKKWTSARNIVGNEVFKGNTDRNSLVYNLFNTSVSAVAVRIVPLEFYGGISMRLELLGCFEPYETCIRYGPWISLSTPKPGNVGDQEPIKKIVGVSGGCLNPVRIQCREYVTHKDYSTMQQKVTCDLSRGLLCRNQDQSQNYCFNYEVRIGCWICGPNVTTTTLPPVPLCPEIPSILSTGCPPDCPPGKVCDGISCVDLIDCPCMQENKRFKPGDILETRDCQTCVCHMKGHSRCEQKKCPKCPEGEKQKLTSACKCTCEGCPKGTVLCPTDGQCINSNLWCDGAIDCPDDEVNCEKTEVPVITTTLPPTVPPTAKPCVTDVPYGVAVCTVQNEYISTFDKLDYKYAVCEHTLMREKAHHWYSVSVFKKCTDSKPQYCDKVVKVIIEGLEFSLGPTINDFKIDNTVFHPDNFWIISEKLKDIRIQRVGQELILKSIRYGFDVIIDSQQNIKIKASYCLVYKVSGLCGNYNNNKRDDKETPEEEQVLSTEHFGDSWSLSTTQKCLPPVCPAETMKHALEICEHVRKPPFEVCASDMVIDTYISLCLSTVCDCLQRPDNDPEECKCSAIENFVQSCRSATKAPIGEWRIAHGCAPKCPPGLVWQDCGSPCEKNCDNFQREDLVCPAVCVSGCFCPPGLLRHGRFCVKPEMCHDCICKGYGDPNYYTFDGHYYPFQGNCTYVLAQHRTNKGYRDFQVFGTNVECQEEPNTACLSAITVRFKGNTVTVEKGKQVTFNGYFIKESDYPFVAEGFNITAVRGRSAVVQVPSINLAVRYFELNFGFYIELPSKYYWNSTEGLCGICNFDASDDMYHRNGYVTDNVEDFAYSWLTNGTREMCTISKIKIPTPPPEICNFTSTACEFVVDPIPFREACKNDVSYSMKPGRSVCRAKLEYAQQCCKRGISLGKWLELNNCGFDCPSNMIFECRSPCVKTCDNYKTLSSQYCTLEPHFSCFCSQDKVLKQGECVDSVVCETCDAEGHVVGDEWSKGPCEKCSCTEDLKVKCTETLCPPTPVCKINETLKIIPPKNGSCCQTYICEMEVKKCKEINPPDCKLGEVAKIDTSKECPVYVCECDEKMCPPLEWPVKLDVGQGTEVHPSGCCKQVVVKCYLNKCPPVPDCPKGFELQVNKGVCCNISTCEKKDVCVYKHTYETVDGMERKLKPEEQYSREYEPDSTWPDGLCRNCTCTGSNGKFTFNCRVEICPKISDFIDKDDYVRVEENVPGACCPKFRRLRCKHGNHTYIAGDSWPSPDGDKCKKYKCVTAPNGEVQKVEQITTCKKDCPPFAEYVEPAPDSPDCCGHCKIVACEENGQVYQVGVKWNSTEKPCYEAECIEKNGTIQTLFVKRECLPIPDTCPKEDIVFDDFGCCKKCRFIPGTCVPMRVPKVETVNFFKMYERNRGTCTNKKPISDLVECRGHCKSSTVYSPKQDTFVSSCDCCTASGSVKREIILDCEDGSELKKTFFQPKDCVCTECGQYGKEILLPTPLK